jgi:hypothetical protein
MFPPEVAIHVVRLACERPARRGRSLSPWDGAELGRPRLADGLVADSSAATIRRILAAPQLKPWRQPLGLSPKRPRDAELVLSLDEKTSRPPRPRLAPTRPAQPHNLPHR